jgi:hypothetical protein
MMHDFGLVFMHSGGHPDFLFVNIHLDGQALCVWSLSAAEARRGLVVTD